MGLYPSTMAEKYSSSVDEQVTAGQLDKSSSIPTITEQPKAHENEQRIPSHHQQVGTGYNFFTCCIYPGRNVVKDDLPLDKTVSSSTVQCGDTVSNSSQANVDGSSVSNTTNEQTNSVDQHHQLAMQPQVSPSESDTVNVFQSETDHGVIEPITHDKTSPDHSTPTPLQVDNESPSMPDTAVNEGSADEEMTRILEPQESISLQSMQSTEGYVQQPLQDNQAEETSTALLQHSDESKNVVSDIPLPATKPSDVLQQPCSANETDNILEENINSEQMELIDQSSLPLHGLSVLVDNKLNVEEEQKDRREQVDVSQEQEDRSKEQEDGSQEQEDRSKVQEDGSQEQENRSKEQEDSSQEQEDISQEQEERSKEQEDRSNEQEDRSQEQEDVSQEQEEHSKEQEDRSQEHEDRSQEQEDVSPEQEECSKEEEDRSKEEEDRSQDHEDVSQEQEERSMKQEDCSNEQEDRSQEQEDGSQEQEERSMEQEDRSKEEEDRSQEQEDVSPEQEECSKELEDRFKEEEDRSQDHEDVSQEQEERSMKQEDRSKEQEDRSQAQEDLSKEQEDSSQEQEDVSQEQEERSKKQEDLSKEQEDRSQEHEDRSQEQEDVSQEQEDVSQEQEDCSQLTHSDKINTVEIFLSQNIPQVTKISQVPFNGPVLKLFQYSVHSIENARYSIGKDPHPDHSNDDRYFAYSTDNNKIIVFGVFDGHDGSNASEFACNYMKQFLKTNKQMLESGKKMVSALEHLFQETEEKFFQSISAHLNEKKLISEQLKGLTSYEAYIQFPHLVARLQEIEPLISGGTTAVVTILIGDMLYIANTGDSRAVLVDYNQQGSLSITQLSEDHTVGNENELQRLEALGLDREDLIRTGRLGSQENTRCIGDYLIKEGYTELDTISNALKAPGIAIPFIKEVKLSSHNCQYLLLMTDGVYSSIESMYGYVSSSDSMTVLSKLLLELEAQNSNQKEVSRLVLQRVEKRHHETYQEAAQFDIQSPRAVQCRKRDDMTLSVCQFGLGIDQSAALSNMHVPADLLPVPVPRSFYSSYSIENARYLLDGSQNPDHSNDDKCFVIDNGGSFKAFGIFDGHDGSNASVFASQYIEDFLRKTFPKQVEAGRNVDDILQEMFLKTDSVFFHKMRNFLNEKKQISWKLKGLTSYEAYIRFPHLVARLQEIEPLISGGTTAVVTILIGDMLYIANTGDSRAVLIQELEQGTIIATQLTDDHTVNNEEELWRLEFLGLDPVELKKMGRLGSQENTRCIGDYLIKEGYTELDTISHAIEQPGIAIPSIKDMSIPLGSQYLLLMTDGVYKSLESMSEESSSFDAMQELAKRLQEARSRSPNSLKDISKRVLSDLQEDHRQTYQKHATVDVRSPLAVQCRKRDDMTLIVYGFPLR